MCRSFIIRFFLITILLNFSALFLLAQEGQEASGKATAILSRINDAAEKGLTDSVAYYNRDLAKLLPELGFAPTIQAELLFSESWVATKELRYSDALTAIDSCLAVQLSAESHFSASELAKTYNHKGIVHELLGAYTPAFENKNKALQLIKGITNEATYDLALYANGVGASLMTLGKYSEAIAPLKEAESFFLTDPEKYRKKIFAPLRNLAQCHQYLGNHQLAIKNYEDALQYALPQEGGYSSDAGWCYMGIGITYENMGELPKAVAYKELGLRQILLSLGPQHLHTGLAYFNLGSAYLNTGEFSRAVEKISAAQEIFQLYLQPDHPYFASLYSNFAIANFYNGNYSVAKHYASSALELQLSNLAPSHSELANTHTILGDIYLATNDQDSAIFRYDKALELEIATLGRTHYSTAKSLANLALAHAKKGNFFTADSLLAAANQSLIDSSSPDANKAANIYVNNVAIQVQWQQWAATQSPAIPLDIIALGEQQISLVNSLIKLEINRASLASTAYLKEVYAHLIRANQMLAHLDRDELSPLYPQSFIYAEASKSQSLRHSLQETDARHFAGIPDRLLAREYNLRVDITYQEKKRQELRNAGLADTDTTVLAISSELFDLNQAYDSLKHRFETDYPEYYRLKYDLSTVSVAEVQQELLDPGEALLEYFVGDSAIYLFLVRKEDYEVIEVERDFPLRDWVSQLRRNIQEPEGYTLDGYATVAWQLYDKLIGPVADRLPERVVIVPDGILGYLPFEALLTEPVHNTYQPARFPYLLRRHEISYSYSATLLREMRNRKFQRPPQYDLLALAPFTSQDTFTTDYLQQGDWLADWRGDTLAPLPYSQLELDSLNRSIPATKLYGAEATRDRFLATAGDYRILHLSTHGKADARVGEYSYLAFAPRPDSLDNELLYVRDLYNLRLNADLVVLSACETGIGELQRGEGIISLARAFAYAGAKSIATTLWRVNDRSTQQIMTEFYRALEAGLPKDRALRQAKLRYLDQHTGTAAHPALWAGVIGIGDMRAIR